MHGVPAKALIPIGGIPMLARVAQTVLDAPSINRAIILAQEPDVLLQAGPGWIAAEPRIGTAKAQDGISRSIAAVAGSGSAPWPVLISTADHALLTPAMIEAFIAGIGEADAAVAVVERGTVEAAYPETKRTWLRFSDGDFTGANLFALTGPRSQQALAAWAEVEHNRKKALRLVMHFGLVLALRAATRTISLDRAIAVAGRKMGATTTAVRLPFAEAAIDVDKPADLRLAAEILRRREGI